MCSLVFIRTTGTPIETIHTIPGQEVEYMI